MKNANISQNEFKNEKKKKKTRWCGRRHITRKNKHNDGEGKKTRGGNGNSRGSGQGEQQVRERQTRVERVVTSL